MTARSPLAAHLSNLTRLMLISTGVLGLVGAGVAVGVWSGARGLQRDILPVQGRSVDALIHAQGLLAGVPLLAQARNEDRRLALATAMQEHLLQLATEAPAGSAELMRRLDELAQGTIARQAEDALVVARTQERIAALMSANEALLASLSKLGSGARNGVGASQWQAQLLSDRIKDLLTLRRAISQVELWMERSSSADQAAALEEIRTRLSVNIDLLADLVPTLGDDLGEDAQAFVAGLRTATQPGGLIAMRTALLADRQNADLRQRIMAINAQLSTEAASLGNRTGIIIDELQVEITDAKQTAQESLLQLTKVAVANQVAADLAGGGRQVALSVHQLLLADGGIDRYRAVLEAQVTTVEQAGATLSKQLLDLGLASDQRALVKVLGELPALRADLLGQTGLVARIVGGLAARQETAERLERLVALLEAEVQRLSDLAASAKAQTGRTMEDLTRLSAAALAGLVLITGTALFIAWRRSRTISRAILASEEDQSRRAGVLATLVQQVEGQVPPLRDSSTSLADTSRTLHTRAGGDQRQAETLSAATQGLSAVATDLSRSAEELKTSINAISEDAQVTQQSAEQAAVGAREARALMDTLAQAAEAIAQSTAGVTSIAHRTRLLALNAAIEAASAGSAGRGFAVVANEVKALANQTATENEQIATRVAAVQAAVAKAAAAVGAIDQGIANASEGQSRIAASVEQQTATTTEMADRLARMTADLGEVARGVSSIAQNASETTREALDLTAMAEQLQSMATRMDDLVKGQTASAARSPVQV
jgi:methyl-accepting chemotaxis protein